MIKQYEKYKDSGIEWLGEIPKHWKAMKLRRLTSVKRGASPRPIDDMIYFDENGEYSWVRIKDVTASERYLEYTEEKLSELGSSKSVKLEPGNLFLSIAGSVGKPIINKIKCCIHDGFVYFPDLELDVEYLYYIFTTGELYNGLGKVGTQLNLNTETVGGITIPIPSSKEEIENIVSFLDHQTTIIDDLIGQNEKLIALLKEKRQAIINEAVTKGLNPNAKMKDSGIEWLGEVPEEWKVTFLKRFSIKITDGAHFSPKTEFEGRNYISVKDVNEYGDIDLVDCKKISQSDFDDLVKNGCQPKINDVLLTKDGTIGRAAIVKESNDFVALSSLGIITPNCNEINSEYLRLFLISGVNVAQMFSMIAGAALTRLTIDKMKHIIITVPPLNIQIDICKYLNEKIKSFDSIMKKKEVQITKLKDYRQSLISEAVTGKIDVRNWKPANN